MKSTQATHQSKFDLYQNVTDRIIQALEAGTAPWLRPWKCAGSHLALPKNAVTHRLYSGINVLLLWLVAEERGYQQCKWLTMKSVNEQGGQVRKGERSTLVVSYKPVEREKRNKAGEPILGEDGSPILEKFAYLNAHYLFNIEQCENLPPNLYDNIAPQVSEPKHLYREFADIRHIIDGINLTVECKPSNRAYYRPKTDVVVMPEMKQFDSEAAYYNTLLHEMTHATGHKSRLNREGISSEKAKFGNQIYAFEELIAEMGAAFLCAHLGFDTVPENASYLASWVEILKSDKRAIFRATGKAREACQYMLETLDVMQQYHEHYPQVI